MPPRLQILTGYYRYNDIWFQWHSVSQPSFRRSSDFTVARSNSLHPEDAAAMRGLFAHDALVHPEHPFNVDGKEGVQMWQGTLADGEERLLFSSAQINYIRYWLYTMGLTKKIIPLPYSDCLLTKDDLPFGVTSKILKTGGDLKVEQKKLDKQNKALKRKGKMSANRSMFENVRKWWSAQKATWLAIDIECWDRMHDVLLEFGWSATYWDDNGKETNESGHFRVEEERNTRQTYVESHPDNYQFGKTEFVKRKLQVKTIKDVIAKFQAKGPLVLVFHDHRGDTKFLTKLGALETWTFLPQDIPEAGLFVIDTQLMFKALEGDESSNERSLQRACDQLEISTRYLHNAGNDAHYTLLALKSMASGEEVDAQRFTRWPPGTNSTAQPEAGNENDDLIGMGPPM